jgi:hypothetical protein
MNEGRNTDATGKNHSGHTQDNRAILRKSRNSQIVNQLGFRTMKTKNPAPPEGAGHSQGERRLLVIRGGEVAALTG